jgi:hypothetical protein
MGIHIELTEFMRGYWVGFAVGTVTQILTSMGLYYFSWRSKRK